MLRLLQNSAEVSSSAFIYPILSDYIKSEGQEKRIGSRLMAIIAEGPKSRIYLSPTEEHEKIATTISVDQCLDGMLVGKAADQLPLYGYSSFSDLYSNRQFVSTATFSDLIVQARNKVEKDGGSQEYARAVGVFLGFAVDKLADTNSMCVTWNITRDGLRNTFSRQAIAMTWDFAEGNPFGNSSGCFSNALDWIKKSILSLPAATPGKAKQHDAKDIDYQLLSNRSAILRYICYADLSDYFTFGHVVAKDVS